MRNIFVIISTLIFLTIAAGPALAVSSPSFPACANPQGSIKVSYSEGTHGIVGSNATYTGKDTVYTLSSETLTQCFCAADGQGIQTNWWKANTLSPNDISMLKSEGWIYIPAGNLWGLSADPYLAKNSNYSCLPGAMLGDGVGGAYEEGEILGLAVTGDSLLVYGSFLIGFILLNIGIRRFKHS